MSDQTDRQTDNVVDDMMDLAATWLQAGVKIGQTAVSAAADGLQATAEAISRLAEDLEDEVERDG